MQCLIMILIQAAGNIEIPIFSILTFVLTIGGGVVIYLFTRNQAHQDTAIVANATEIATLKKDFNKKVEDIEDDVTHKYNELKDSLHNINLKTLAEINAISLKIAEFKRDK